MISPLRRLIRGGTQKKPEFGCICVFYDPYTSIFLSPFMYSPLGAMHLSICVFRCTTQFQNACKVMPCSAFVGFYFTSSTSSSTSSVLSNEVFFRAGEQEKSQGAETGEYRGKGQRIRPIFIASYLTLLKELFADADAASDLS